MFDAPHLAPRAANRAPLTPLDLLDKTVADRPGETAVLFGDDRYTWAEVDAAVQRMAEGLAAQGVRRGDVVSVLAGNRPEMIIAHFAVPLLGAVLNTINTRLDAEAVRYILDHSGAKVVLADAACAPLAAEVAGDRPFLVFDGAPAAGAPFEVMRGPLPEARRDWREAITDEAQPIALNYTSGTTGNPKGVVLHHRGAWQNAMGNRSSLGFGPGTVYLWTLPLFHCNGWCHGWAVTAAGGVHVCLDGVNPEAIFEAIARHGVTDLACAPVVLYMLLDHPARESRNAESPRVMVGTGGAAPTTSLIESMGTIGFDLTHLYGLTECYGPCTINPLPPDMAGASVADKARYLASQGRPHATVPALRVIDETGADVPADGESQGEIVLRGNTIMSGYLKNPEATEAAFEGGWFRTGDIAVMGPDGRIHIRDRAKDVIITGGENVSSLEIEEMLHRHPAVALAAVVAAPHPRWGETPCAFVEAREPLEAAELEAFCREHLAGFKRPRRFVFGEIPKTATGKVQKFLLREAAADLARDDET
ncbi:AMP-binding protein [Salipiger mucosus]|uniref:3-methylmercaptopropionyl-CoA ligase n=1 Tax=Salipiger mucosus DSM 16094 TaxID=1123237 RepID=S9QGD6_9RHOB|nr:AMP-binding protein [Salipiger mucosus]EPX78633.1 Long-chain-fatty-acid--CoA ligase [Salipiger mucosus DSM 16094]